MKNIIIPAKGKKLMAVLHPSMQGNSNLVLIICHGFRGSKDGGGRAVKLAERIAEFGLSVLRFDFTPQEMLSRQVNELGSVVSYCRHNIASSIILLGRSMGGSASLEFAARDGGIRGLCLWSTPWDLEETFRLSLGNYYEQLLQGHSVSVRDEYGALSLEPEFIADFSHFALRERVKLLHNVPLLILHGSQDAIVPVHKAESLWENALEPKQLAIIQAGDHQFLQHGQQAADIVIKWLKSSVLRSSI